MSRARVMIVALTLFAATFLSGCAALGCPQALLSGVLVERDGTLAVQSANGDVTAVDWSNYSLRRDGGELVVAEWFHVLAREGDTVDLGGGADREAGPFKVCGQVAVVARG